MDDFFQTTFETKLAKIIACIRNSPEMQRMFKRESERRLKIDRELFARYKRVFKEKPARASRPITKSSYISRRKMFLMNPSLLTATPICDAVFAKHREEMAAKIAAKIVAKKKAEACTCSDLVAHLLRCKINRPFFDKKKAA